MTLDKTQLTDSSGFFFFDHGMVGKRESQGWGADGEDMAVADCGAEGVSLAVVAAAPLSVSPDLTRSSICSSTLTYSA